MAGLFDWLFDGSDEETVQQQTTSIPSWISAPTERMLQRGEALTQLPYTPYPGPRVVPLSAPTLSSIELASRPGYAGERVTEAYNVARDTTSPIGLETLYRFINPYVTEALDPAARALMRKAEEMRIANQAKSTAAGAFGGTRGAITEAELQRNLLQQLEDLYSKGYASAYEKSLDTALAERESILRGAGAMGTLAGQGEQAKIGDIASMAAAGATLESQKQKNLDVLYQDFLKQQQYPYEQLGFLSQLITGAPKTTTQTTTTPYVQPGPLQQLTGLATSWAGIANQLGWNPFGTQGTT